MQVEWLGQSAFRLPAVERLGAPAFDTDGLASRGGPLVVVPAAP